MLGKYQKYYQVTQIEVEHISHLVKFWLDNIKNYLINSKKKDLKNITFNTTSVLSDFISLYELNRPAFSRLDKSQIKIRDKTIGLSPLKKFGWQINTIDMKGKVNKYTVSPIELGMSILGMFSIAPFRRVLDPDIIMSICYYYDYHLIS